MKLYLLLFFTLFTKTLFCQDKYPKDYFSPPLKIPIILAGTFGELRSNHFHAGIDIKTQGREGIPIFAPADGYVSRIKIGQYGYGKALYINHPNGYTTVYAHLKRFAKNIQNFVKTNQYKKKKYAIGNLFPKQNKFIYKKGNIIGYTGDTGSSGSPHLHYEIRDTKTEKIINPLLFNLDVLDSIKPTIKQLMVYPIDGATVNNSNNKAILDFKKIEEGKYITDRITAAGKIGFGIYLFDRLNNASNKNGIYSLEMKVNGNTVYYHDVETFSFSESKFINLHIDYSHYKKYRKRFQKTYIDTVNKLSTYENLINNGIINIEKKNNYIVEIIGSDFKKNTTTIKIPVKGVKNNYKKQELDTTGYKINCNHFNKFKLQNVTVAFPSKSFYNNCFINFKIDNGIAHIHKPTIPLNKKYTLTFGTSHLSEAQQQQVYIANVTNPKYPRYVSTKKKTDKVYTSTKSLGSYTLNFDTKKPIIKLLNFQNGKWISKNKTLKVRIRDKETGIKNYKATIDNKWILMEYNHKRGVLTYDFSDKKLVGGKHIFKIVVSDNVGNTKTLKATFFKK